MCMIYKKLFLILVLFISFLTAGAKVQAAADIDGWGWSDGIGWISFNCTNGDTTHTGPTGTCGTGTGLADYKVTFSTTTTTGTFSGHAWSSNVGWISFNAGDGTHPNVTTDLSTGLVTGWARALAGVGRTDGWDGWIRFSDTGDASPKYPSGYVDGTRGITFDPAAGIFKGYAWGDTNVGWLTFSPSVGTPVNCEPNCGNPSNSSSLLLTANGENSITVRANESNQATVRIDWDLNNVNNVQISSGNWPNGTVGLSTYLGQSLLSDGNADAVFTGITATTSRTLRLSYWHIPESFSDTAEVTITLEPFRPNTSTFACVRPANAQLCNGSATDVNVTPTIRLFGMCNADQIPPTAAVACEFYCPSGFKVINNVCKRPGSIEEQ